DGEGVPPVGQGAELRRRAAERVQGDDRHPPTVPAVAVNVTAAPSPLRVRVKAAAGLPTNVTWLVNVTVRLRTRDRWPLPSSICTPWTAWPWTSKAPMSAWPTARVNPAPRWSVAKVAGLLPALMSGLPGIRAMVGVGPPLAFGPAGSSSGLVPA